MREGGRGVMREGGRGVMRKGGRRVMRKGGRGVMRKGCVCLSVDPVSVGSRLFLEPYRILLSITNVTLAMSCMPSAMFKP